MSPNDLGQIARSRDLNPLLDKPGLPECQSVSG